MRLSYQIKKKIKSIFKKKELPLTGFIHHYLYGLVAKKTPVIVYQMGKVGSSSISDSLKAYGIRPVFHIHKFNPPPNNYGKRVYRDIIKKKRKANFITSVREPIARNISSFGGFIRNHPKYSVDDFVKRFPLYHKEEDRGLKWFDEELKAITGINVFKHPFPKQRGWNVINKGNFRLLILKIEKDDRILEKAIINFLDLKRDFTLNRTNVTRKKTELYKKFKNKVIIPKWYIDKMLNSKYCHHFYSEKEIEDMKTKYNIGKPEGRK